MDFIKKNYEKILLGLVLAGLIGTLVFMLFYITADQEAMDHYVNDVINSPVKPLPDLNLAAQTNVITRLQSPYALDFEKTNKLFNSMEWQKMPDGTLLKISSDRVVGPGAVVVTNIEPLYLVITNVAIVTNEFGARYVFNIEKQADKNPSKRRPQQHYASLNDKNDTFTLKQVKGAPENPDALVIQLEDSKEMPTIPRGQAYRRIDGYQVDFRYDPEKKFFHNRREGDKVSFGGADYVIVEVNANELILSDQSNQKKTSLPFTP
jgi:hypothetical protein